MKPVVRFTLALCIASILVTGCQKEAAVLSTQPAQATETAPAIQTAVATAVNPVIGGFYKALPARYNFTTQKYPLLIFLHDAEATGSNLSRLSTTAIPAMLEQGSFPPQFTVGGNHYSFIVITPQFKAWPQPADINAMIDFAIAHYRVDESRIYIVGASMGGGSAWDYAIAYPNRAAAIVPISGASWPSREALGSIVKAGLPVWAFHNSDDNTISAAATTAITDNINSFNPAVAAHATIWPLGGHDAWTRATSPATKACNGKNIYEWMLQYKK